MAHRTNLFIRTIKKNMCFILSLIARTPVAQRGSILPNSWSNFQSISTKPEPAHTTPLSSEGKREADLSLVGFSSKRLQGTRDMASLFSSNGTSN
eukprot:1145307-Pelagomonas_calceolata.AAC.1